MQKIRILVVVGSLRIGGQERVATSIIEYIDKEKFQVDYLVYDDIINENTDIVEANGGRIIREKDVYSSRFSIVKRFKEIMTRFGPYDIVHAHGMFNNGYVMRAAKKVGVKCRIAHAHSTNDGKDTKSFIYKLYKTLMKRYLNKYATRFVACGVKAGEYLFGKTRFDKDGQVFYNRIDAGKFEYNEKLKVALREKLNLADVKIFIIVGRLVPLKNHKLAFEAFKNYHAENSESVLLVLGDGPYRNDLEEVAYVTGLTGNIKFLGNVSNVNEYMIAADCLLMPSLYEGLPVTLIEAQAAGLHCIVSDTVTKEVDITGLISWRSLNDLNGWVADMKLNVQRENTRDKIIANNYDYSNFTDWLTEFFNTAIDVSAK